MPVIKRLIFIEWFKSFVAAVVILATLVSVADLISGFLRGSVTATQVILNHLVEYPTYLSQIFPVACLIASLFSINKLKNRNELTAIFASGFSRKRFFFTIFQASLIVASIQFFISAQVQPFFKMHRHELLGDAQERFSNLESQGLKASTIGTGKVWYKSSDYFVNFAQFDKSNNVLNDATFFFIGPNKKLSLKIHAERIEHLQGTTWNVINGTYYDSLDQKSFPQLNKLVSNTLSINESPADFIQLESDITTLGVIALWNYISQLQQSGLNVSEYFVLFLDYFSSTLICIIFAMLAATAAFSPNRRGSSFGKSVGFVFVFTLLYWLIYSYLLELGRSAAISPIAATFSVPAVFSLFLLFIFFRHRKLRG